MRLTTWRRLPITTFRYRIGEMIGLDRAHREVHLAASYDAEGQEITPPRSILYDTLVIAVGSTSNDFGTPGAKEFAISLDTADQAVRFHQRLVNRFIRAHAQPGPVRPGQLHVTIIGAGATGTELAAELHRTTRQVVAYGLDRIDPEKDLKITLVEAAERILPAVPPRVAEGATRLLERLSIEVRTRARVVEVRQDGVRLADGDFIPSELVVWAAGVKGPDLLKDLDGLEASRSNQLVVTPTLQTTRDPDVFAIGDCAFLLGPGETRPIPPRAQAASQQSTHLVKQLTASLRWEAPSAVCLPGFRVAGLAGRVQHGWQSDGLSPRQRALHRRLFRPPDVPVALQDAPEGFIRFMEGDARHHRSRSDPPHRASRETALDQNPVMPQSASQSDPKILPDKELAFVFSTLRANDLIWSYVVLPGPMYCWYVRNTCLENSLKCGTVQCGFRSTSQIKVPVTCSPPVRTPSFPGRRRIWLQAAGRRCEIRARRQRTCRRGGQSGLARQTQLLV